MLDHFYPIFTQHYEDGLAWNQHCLRYALLSGDQQLIGRSHLNIGVGFYMRGDYPACLENYQKALAIFERLQDNRYIGRTCNEFSVYWRKQKQFEKGLQYLDRAYRACSNCQDTACVETSLNNRAVIYEMMGNYDLALTYYHKADQVAQSIGDTMGQAYIYMDAAQCYRLRGDLDSATWLTDRSIEILTKLNNLQGVGLNLINKGDLQVQQGQLSAALATYQQCIELAETLKYPDLLKTAHYQIGKAYAAQKNFEQSFFHLERSHYLNDSLLNAAKVKSLAEMEVKYETEKIQHALLAEEQQHVQTELKVANRNLWLLIVGALTLTILLLSLIFYQRTLRIAQAEKDRALLLERERSLHAVFDATENERQRIAKDLHDGIGQQMSGLRLAWQNMSLSAKNLTTEEHSKWNELTTILDSTAADVRELSHRMMPKTLAELGLASALDDLMEKTFRHTAIHYQFESLNVQERLPQKIELALFRIVQELLQNMLKHAQASQVSVQLFKNQHQLILTVEDNGVGMDLSAKQEGHGLRNIESRLSTIGGILLLESEKGKGTRATIRVAEPLTKN